MTAYLTIFRRFLTTFERFPKVLQNFSEGRTNVAEDSPKISEDLRGRPEDISIIHQRTKYNLRDKLDISESIDILTSEDMENTPLESRMWSRMNLMSGLFASKTLMSIK